MSIHFRLSGRITSCLAMILLSVILVTGCIDAANPLADSVGKPADTYFSPMYKGWFTVSAPPKVNSTVNLTFHIKQIKFDAAPRTHIKILLPSGVELIDGELNTTNDLVLNQTQNITVTIRPIQEGNLRVRAAVWNTTYRAYDRAFYLFIESGLESGSISIIPPKRPSSPQLHSDEEPILTQ